ncbi:hypothetical protein JCM11491_001741 [Sporobolomyces phaffii]
MTDTGDSRLACVDNNASKVDWGHVAPIIYVSGKTLGFLIDKVAHLITAHRTGGTVSNSSPVRRMTRRGTEEEHVYAVVSIGGVELEVPFVHDADGKTTMDLLDFYSPASSALATRDLPETASSLTEGSATFYANGTLDTFTIGAAVTPSPLANNATSPGLAKRDNWSLHTTYWADPGHESTSLSYDKLRDLVGQTYTHLRGGVWQACGYMANSGTWHGAFRHWTGDNGYTIGECEAARRFK